jgi:hypothetical protein
MPKRDFNEREFSRAAERNGFEFRGAPGTLQRLWLYDRETGTGYGMILRRGGGVYRRESLARAIQKRRKEQG